MCGNWICACISRAADRTCAREEVAEAVPLSHYKIPHNTSRENELYLEEERCVQRLDRRNMPVPSREWDKPRLFVCLFVDHNNQALFICAELVNGRDRLGYSLGMAKSGPRQRAVDPSYCFSLSDLSFSCLSLLRWPSEFENITDYKKVRWMSLLPVINCNFWVMVSLGRFYTQLLVFFSVWSSPRGGGDWGSSL